MIVEDRIPGITREVCTALDTTLEAFESDLALPRLTEEERRLIASEPARIASLMDHTALKIDTTPDVIDRLCEEAIQYRFHAVCVNPIHVRIARELVAGSGIKLVSVAGFPLAGVHAETKAFEAERAVREGADEIDMVMNISALRSGDLKSVKQDIDEVRNVCGQGITLKVIIETGALTFTQKVQACLLTIVCRADFVKTSTGFGPSGADPQDVRLLRSLVGEKMGVKASAGIRDLGTALAMVTSGANRIGCSHSAQIMKEALGLKT